MEDELDLIIQNMVSAGESEDNIALVINSYSSEKKKSTPTATPPKSVSGTPTGSSGGVNPAFKSSIASPIPDFNSMQSGKSVVEKPKTKLQKPPEKEDTSFFDYLKEGIDSGIAIASKSIYDTPALLYDNVAGLITNPLLRAMGVEEDKLASSKKLADNLGFKNIPSEILKEKIKVSNEKLNDYALKNGVDPLTAIENGEYKNAAKLVTGTTMQSLPMMVVALLSGGSKTALSLIGLSTASTKNSDLEESNPEMGLGTRILNADNAGIIEATTGHLFTGGSGAVMKRIITDKGVEAGSKIIAKSFRSTIEKSIEKNPLVGAFGEVIEESAVEFGNQVNDISSGIRTELDFRAIKNAGLSATGMGGLQTLGVYGAKGYVKAKTYTKLKSNNKEVFKLRSEIDNGNLSPENKAILGLRADRLEAENKKLLGTEIEKAKALPTEQKAELNALNNEFEDLKTKFDDVDDADDISENLKPALKEEIKLQASKNQKRKTEILSQNDGLEVKDDFSKFEGVEPDFDLENGKISSLPLKEQNRLNKLAVEEITKGDKTIEYTKEQVSETANEIYKNEQTPPTPEAQPQAEVPQQAEAEKVATPPVEDVVATSVEEVKPISQLGSGANVYFESEKYRVNDDTKNGKIILNVGDAKGEMPLANIEFDNIKEAVFVAEKLQDNAPEGLISSYHNIDNIIKGYKEEYATQAQGDIVTDANVRPTATNVGESGITEQESPAKEGVSKPVDGGEGKGDVEVSDLDHAKSQIEKGVLLWNGDSGAERVNLGIPWADIRKGEADIKRGKPETVPAKRLIEALKTAKEKGGYEYIQGRGGVVNKQFVSLSDIQRSTNEYDLTDLEQKEVDADEYESARKYDEDFNSLTENEQTELLENYENSQDNSGTPSADSGQLQSESDVSKEKEGGTGKKPTTKERIAERIKLSDANIEEARDVVKEKLDAIYAKLGIKPSAEHLAHLKDIKSNGVSFDSIIDIVADLAKAIANGAIVTSEHIKQAIDAYNTQFDDKIDPKAVEERINPKKEAEKNSKDLLSKMTDVPNSGEIGKYISRDNIEDSDAEEEFTTNQDYDKLKLIDSLIYGKEIVEQAKADFGDNYIEELIKNINSIKNVDSKTLHIISLENDLRKRRKETTDVQEKEFLTEQINRLQTISQKLANTVSRALNLNKLRKLSESGVNPNDKSESIYTKEELETKNEIAKSFGKDIDDIQEQYEESFQEETDAVETTPDNEENILKYSKEDFDRELQKAKDELGNDYNISVFENLKRQAKKDKLSDKKEDLKAAKAKVLEDIRKVVRESMGQMSVNPLAKPLEFATLVTKLAKIHIQDGALSLEEVANNIYNDLKDMSKDISKESIFNILKAKPKKVMSEATKRKIYITLLNKNIESLDAQIEAKKRDVINRVDKYKNDAEIKDLRDKRTEKREELAKVDPSYAESRKLAADLKLAQKSLDEYQRRIDENDLSPKENQPKVVAEKLKKLRERRDAKRKEFLAKKKKYDDSLKPVAVPPTKEELADKKYLADVNNKINSLTKRIEDLKANKPKTNDGKSTVWNAKISELENEVNRLKEIKNPTKKKQNLTEEEIFQKKIDQKIRQVEKALQDHKDKKPKFTVGANSVWSEELSAIKTELSNLRNENSDAKKKAREVKNKAVDLLINSGYGKEINVTKKEVDADGNVVKVKSTKNILDWKKLAGESGSIANISKAIKTALADQNLSEKEIGEMVVEMKTAIEEIKTSITEKSLSDLQNRNKIPKSVNVKTEAKNLSELYNQGIFDDNMDKYDVALNRILGFNQFKEKQYQDLKDYSRLLSSLFANKNIFNNEFMSEDALKTQVAHINKQINEIVNKASMGKGFTPQKIVSLIRDYSDMALLSKLLSLKQTIENPWSGFTERKYQQIGSMFDKIKLTPELKNHINKGAWSVFKDIAESGSPDLGDSSFSDIRSRKIDDKIRGVEMGKKAGRIRNAVSAIISGTVYLNGADSYNKVKILESVFAKAMIDILSNKNYGRNNTMTVKEATIFVSEALTGESFNQAIVKAEQVIKDTNEEAGKDVLPYTDANIYRLAMDVVRDNLTSTGVVDAETVKAVFAGSFKAAGSSLGHESNNAVSELYKKTSQEIDRKIREAVKKKDWVGFTKYVSLNVMKNITMPFVSGRFNWVVLAAQKSGANLGLSMLVTGNKKSNNKIDFSTEEGVKNLTEAVHWKIRHDLTVKRSVTGLALNVLAIAALAASGGDDELEKLLEKSPILKKLFKWLGPPLMNLYLASQKGGKEEAFNFIMDFYSVTGNEDRGSVVTQFNVLLDDKSTDKQNTKAWGYIGKTVGKAFDTPIPWRLGKDIKNIENEINGKEQYIPNYNATSFLSGALQGGFFETIGMREILSGHEEEKYIPKDGSVKGIMEGRLHPKRKTAAEKRDARKTERENERELRIKAREEGVRYVAPRN